MVYAKNVLKLFKIAMNAQMEILAQNAWITALSITKTNVNFALLFWNIVSTAPQHQHALSATVTIFPMILGTVKAAQPSFLTVSPVSPKVNVSNANLHTSSTRTNTVNLVPR